MDRRFLVMEELITGKGSNKLLEAKVVRKLGIPYFGYILYHSGNVRIKNFIESKMNLLDQIIGSKFAIFVVADEHKNRLKIDEILSREEIDEELRINIKEWKNSAVPFDPDKSFEIAEALGINRRDIPCLLIFRSAEYQSFAKLKLEDKWFPMDSSDSESLRETIDWLSKLFDRLYFSIKRNLSDEEAIKEFQKQLDKLSTSNNVVSPILKQLKSNITLMAKVPFEILASLSSILQNVGTNMIKAKIESAFPTIPGGGP